MSSTPPTPGGACAALADSLAQTDIEALLKAAREQLTMDLTFISEWTQGQQVFRFLDGDSAAFGLSVGVGTPLEGSYCRRVLDGRLPAVIPDTLADPRTAELEVTHLAHIGAYVGAPLRFRDGRVYGMLCGVSQTPDLSLRERDARFLRVFAATIASQLERRERLQAAQNERGARIQAATAPGAIVMAFQPAVALRTGRVVGVEALARFQLEPRRGPDKWFDEAWAIGRGVELELAAVRTALRAFETLPQEVFLAVNVAPRTILDPALAEALREAPGARLVLEMTEHARVEDYGPLLAALAPLRARGVRLSIDDAGAGFASMQHILRLRPDFIKLDLVLTRDIDTDPTRRALTSALVAFGRDVGALILAEGIETRSELVALQRLGVAFGQGYHLARPMPLPAPAWIDVGTLSRRPEALRVSMSPDPVI